jgi:integrase/recombinase XerD
VKGGKDRVVAWRWLKKYLEKVRPHLLLDPGEQAVFLGREGVRLGNQGVYMVIKRHVATAGIKKSISPHTLRHSCGTHLSDAGCDIRVIQELFGHAKVDTTAVYIAVSASRLKDAHRKYHPREKGQRVA